MTWLAPTPHSLVVRGSKFFQSNKDVLELRTLLVHIYLQIVLVVSNCDLLFHLAVRKPPKLRVHDALVNFLVALDSGSRALRAINLTILWSQLSKLVLQLPPRQGGDVTDVAVIALCLASL